MAQDPFKTDQIQIEPGSAGTRRIRRALDGSLEFTDSLVPGGITLSQLAGLRSVANILVVGKSGAGAAYTTVQAALDAIPAGASETNPYTVLIAPGVYNETLTLVRNGVSLVGLGGVYLKSLAEATPDGVGADHTIIIQAGLGSVPRRVTLHNLTISNSHSAYGCIRVVGGSGSEVGLTGIEISNCRLSPVAAGGNRGIWATSINNLMVQNCQDVGDTGLSLHTLVDCAAVSFHNSTMPAVSFSADAAGTLPSLGLVGSTLIGCVIGKGSSLDPVLSVSLLGIAGTFEASDGTIYGNVTIDGDQPVSLRNLLVGDVTIDTTAALTLFGVKHDTVAAAAGTTLAEQFQQGTTNFVAEATKDVVFAVEHPDTTYIVGVEFDGNPGGGCWISNKTVTGFRINLAAPATVGVVWTAIRV